MRFDGNFLTDCYCTIGTLIGGAVSVAKGDEDYVARVKNYRLSMDAYAGVLPFVKYVGVTPGFKKAVDYFKTPKGETPAGFRYELRLESDGLLAVDLVRDIAYGKNGQLRPTDVIFSADSANPYEVAPIKDMLGNLTCNPGIIYDLFINNPKANIGNKFKTRDEVMEEIGNILGPGCDISVELNDPFNASEQEILEEAARFKEMLSEYRVVIKVPHTGPVNGQNVKELLEGDKKFSKRYYDTSTEDALRGHNLALMLHENGYRVNFTLMFEPYQTNLALQAKPYFINSFIRHRAAQTQYIEGLLNAYETHQDEAFLKQLRSYMVDKDYFAKGDDSIDLLTVKTSAELLCEYRHSGDDEGFDGLDGIRHNLRVLRQCNLPDTRLIICSMEGDRNYPEIDKLFMEEEFADQLDRIVLTAEPGYLARFTSANQVVSYQRRFMNAANGQK